MSKKYQLAFSLLYGCGLRKAEFLKLRVKDIDFAAKTVFVFRDKGGKDRVTMLPNNLILALKKQIQAVRVIHKKGPGRRWWRNQLATRLGQKVSVCD